MNKKQMHVQVINPETGKIFSLPTLYTDRTEACVCGQNYVRDRQAEEPSSKLFFRVLIAEGGQIAPEDYLWDDQLEEEEDDFDWENPACQTSQEDDAEEPAYETLAELLSVFNAIRPNH